MTSPVAVAAADLGASGGRVIVGRAGPGQLDLHQVHRFANTPVRLLDTLHWDILALYDSVLAGLRAAARDFDLASAGVDTWGVDFGLLGPDGSLLGNPVHYRDERTAGVADRFAAVATAAQLYEITGTQLLPFNTIFQLAAATGTAQLDAAATLLLIPDLLGYWLTGQPGAELTNASTTQLLDARTQDWAWPLIERAGLRRSLFPPLRRPGEQLGPVRPEVAAALGLAAPLPVTAVGSHDTASAVAAVPARGARFGYVSCGTWSLVGLELSTPVLSAASMRANFTNEAGIDGTVRYLRNVMGLWLLQECVRSWSQAGLAADPAELAAQAAQVPALSFVIDPDDPVFLPPGDMPGRITAACQAHGQAVPDGPAELTRCILDSLALAYRRAIIDAQELSGQAVDTVHVVGGGSRNELLCQLTADACGLPVVAGPAEATAIGNILVQARALGAAPADLDGMRALVSASQELRRYEPSGNTAPWRRAAARLS
ncbi:MAG TPA: rhamnulokinase family protein [Streptosporangiaceae bacterium]|nr:rhamnulokinase family protein [Streptosporangiaceae bacterium]